MEIVKNGIYKNVAGSLVYVLDVGFFGDCEDEMVFYMKIAEKPKLFAMPKEEFCAELEPKKQACGQRNRFQLENASVEHDEHTTELIKKAEALAHGKYADLKSIVYVKGDSKENNSQFEK